jgi:RNA polymerase sigma-54 factor
MALELKQGLKLSQQLVMTPQLQQAIKLLQLSRMELENVITSEMMENPILEEADPTTNAEGDGQSMEDAIAPEQATEGDNVAPAETKGEDDEFNWDSYIDSYNSSYLPSSGAANISPDELPSFENVITRTQTLTDHLLWQLQLATVPDDLRTLIEELIGNLNDDGYLTTTIEQVAQQKNVGVDRVEEAMYKLQEFDPIGVGARSLKECLLLQAWALKLPDDMVETIIENHLSDLEKKNYPAIAKALDTDVEEVIEAVKIIYAMEPKPGRSFAGQDAQYITPDVFVYKVGVDYVIVLNEEGLPRLRISQFYRSMLQQGHEASAPPKGQKKLLGPTKEGMTREYIQEKLRSALWLIKSIYQRQRTIYKVADAIMKRQKDFLEHGVGVLKPMILRDIADDIGMHESTVSRVTTNKYIHTPHGVFELKFFFNTGLGRITGAGDDVAAESVKEKIRLLISKENPKNPFSDQQIAEYLKKDNIDIARRTVAKYREQLGVLSSSKRKKLF